jgi:hypothetical protein
MRYGQGGGLTAESRRRRELARLAELDRVLEAGPARDTMVTRIRGGGSVCVSVAT